MTSYDIMNQFWNWRYVLKSRFSQSLLNYVPFVPTCFACLRAYVPCVSMPLMCLRAFVPQITTWLRALIYHVPKCFHFSRGYVLTCVYILFHAYVPLHIKVFHAYLRSRAHVHVLRCLQQLTKYTEAHFYTLHCCFSLDYLTFHSIQNPKTNSCF